MMQLYNNNSIIGEYGNQWWEINIVYYESLTEVKVTRWLISTNQDQLSFVVETLGDDDVSGVLMDFYISVLGDEDHHS